MRRYVLSRVGQLVITLLIYITLVYFLLQAMPGDISMIYLQNPRIPQAAREELKKQLGLDRSPVMQYFSYMKNFFTGNLGVSFSQYPRPVWDILIERLPRTLVLFLTANSLSFYVGFVLGRVIAWKRGASIDHVATVVGITFWTAFYPLLALVLIWLFAYTLKWLPLNQFIEPSLWVHAPWPSNTVFGFMVLGVVLISVSIFIIFWRLTRGQRKTRRNIGLAWGLSAAVVAIALGVAAKAGMLIYIWDIVRHMILPVVTLTLINFAGTMLLMRDSMLETVEEDYVMAARAKGLPDAVVRDRYAARNALLPTVTSLVLSLASSMSGGLVTETMFSWPGLGQVLFRSALANDYPLATGALVFTGIFLLIAHFVADMLYAALDPRISYTGEPAAEG
ncbi:MAG: ABC transporter permease [Bacillota bacterium]|jgi:peptide/nickel transport system permease protein|nr:ABC transporter permease [Bacillota bacterium]HOK70333.1 ABC transporter permease [Bacillota bacterium]HOO30208.1 ABC transporter permease [Bacillota bacterium]HPQ02023.1 ABC transporter permease [Bacillota bacterium]HPZ13053.1 ABC transporter permease [Bacillota bacterium]